jgi:hypothetical protein
LTGPRLLVAALFAAVFPLTSIEWVFVEVSG